MTTRTLELQTPGMETEKAAFDGKFFYRAGGAAALMIVLAGLLDILIMFLPGTGIAPGARTVLDWYALLQGSPFLALRDMGLLNMITMSCSVMVFFALYEMHRHISPQAAALALVLACIGAAIYIANNVALPMLTLSQHYAAEAGADQKALWAAAGQALLGQEDLTAGAFPGFLFAELAGALMGFVAMRGRIFRRWEAGLGLVATGCLFFFNLCAAFIPALYDYVMLPLGAGGGLLSLAWYVLIARRLGRVR